MLTSFLQQAKAVNLPFELKKAGLNLDAEVKKELPRIRNSRTEKASRVERAKILLTFNDGQSLNSIAKASSTHRPKIDRCLDKALQPGPLTALDDLPRSGNPPKITPEAKAGLIDLAGSKPRDLGDSFELWTNRLLAEHDRLHCFKHCRPSPRKIRKGIPFPKY